MQLIGIVDAFDGSQVESERPNVSPASHVCSD
jgi:hypothetical protein